MNEGGVSDERWRKSQKEEVSFWAKSNVRRIIDWPDMVKRCFGIDFDTFFKDKDILEIGAGPHGIIYDIHNSKSRIGLEPMDMPFLEDWKKKIVKKGIGEKLEFSDKSFDVVICFNVLDHCINPAQVVRECERILRTDGIFLLWIHALRSYYKFLLPVISIIDRTHPHHLSQNEIRSMIQPFFIIKHEKRIKGVGTRGHLEPNGNIKILVGNYITENVWFTLIRRN